MVKAPAEATARAEPPVSQPVCHNQMPARGNNAAIAVGIFGILTSRLSAAEIAVDASHYPGPAWSPYLVGALLGFASAMSCFASSAVAISSNVFNRPDESKYHCG